MKYVYKHFAILGPESNRGAEASECAAEQDAFWPYHDQVFADQNENHSSLNQEKLVSIAADIGLDTSAFTDCLSSGRYSLQISRESQTVQSLGNIGSSLSRSVYFNVTFIDIVLSNEYDVLIIVHINYLPNLAQVVIARRVKPPEAGPIGKR